MTNEHVERTVAALERLAVWADWTGYVGDGQKPGVFESNAVVQAAAITEASETIASGIRDGLYEIARAIRENK